MGEWGRNKVMSTILHLKFKCVCVNIYVNKVCEEQQYPSTYRSENGQLITGPMGWKLQLFKSAHYLAHGQTYTGQMV